MVARNLTPELKSQKQENLSELEASLVYVMNSRLARANSVSKMIDR